MIAVRFQDPTEIPLSNNLDDRPYTLRRACCAERGVPHRLLLVQQLRYFSEKQNEDLLRRWTAS